MTTRLSLIGGLIVSVATLSALVIIPATRNYDENVEISRGAPTIERLDADDNLWRIEASSQEQLDETITKLNQLCGKKLHPLSTLKAPYNRFYLLFRAGEQPPAPAKTPLPVETPSTTPPPK